jgi:hypothetical protein
MLCAGAKRARGEMIDLQKTHDGEWRSEKKEYKWMKLCDQDAEK